MTAERWQQIERLYHAARELPPSDRAQYLSTTDQSLRAEVESLLRNGEEAGFLDRRAIDVAAEQHGSEIALDLAGRKLGRYDVISRLGAGGMGIVYRAHDTRLKRDVALKVLPQASIIDEERKRRFVQEARSASALNHPNIVSIYDTDRIDGIDFITMECVPGKTLAQVIGRKALSPPQALTYATQIAAALAAAHAVGIVHRDLKPGNVMITAEGQVKILDFGLAKLAEPTGGEASTDMAWILGTPAYMSPEQAEGKRVDARSDIFSFGTVLYEMLAGRPAFLRESTSGTVAAILRDEPAPIPGLAPAIARLIAHCLQKDPNRRYHAIADVRIVLEDVQGESPEVIVGKARHRSAWIVAVVFAFVAATGGVGWLLVKPNAVNPSPPVTQVTFDGRLSMHPSVSADGKYVAYASDRAGGANLDIWVLALPTGESVRLTKDEANEDWPSFSPDGTTIAFRSEREGGGIYVVPVLGGEPRLLDRGTTRPLYSPDGKYLLLSRFSGRQETLIMPAEGGEPRNLDSVSPVHLDFPIWSPDATRILAVESTPPFEVPKKWFVAPVAGGQASVVYQVKDQTSAGTPLGWLRDNRILFSAQSGDAVHLWLARFSTKDGQVMEPFDRLTFGVGQITSASAANNGTVVFSSAVAPTRLWSFPLPKGGRRSQGEMLAFPSTASRDYFPSLSKNGKMAYLSQRSSKWHLWIRDLQHGNEKWLASIEETRPYNVSAVMKPDGTRVAYSHCVGISGCTVFTVSSDGGPSQKLCEACGQMRAWSADGMMMASQSLVLDRGQIAGYRINWVDPVRGTESLMIEKSGLYLFSPDFSPDGGWIAFQARPRANGRLLPNLEQLFVAPIRGGLPVGPEQWITITELGHFDAGPHWSPDGKALYFTSDRDGSNCLWAVRLDAITKKPFGKAYAVRHFHASPRQYSSAVWPNFSLDRDRIVINLEQVQSELWMTELPEAR